MVIYDPDCCISSARNMFSSCLNHQRLYNVLILLIVIQHTWMVLLCSISSSIQLISLKPHLQSDLMQEANEILMEDDKLKDGSTSADFLARLRLIKQVNGHQRPTLTTFIAIVFRKRQFGSWPDHGDVFIIYVVDVNPRMISMFCTASSSIVFFFIFIFITTRPPPSSLLSLSFSVILLGQITMRTIDRFIFISKSQSRISLTCTDRIHQEIMKKFRFRGDRGGAEPVGWGCPWPYRPIPRHDHHRETN